MQITILPPPFYIRLEYTVELTPHYMAGWEQFLFLQRLQKQSLPEVVFIAREMQNPFSEVKHAILEKNNLFITLTVSS